MQETDGEYIQLNFFQLLPGSAGGRALRAVKGVEYFSQLGKTAAAKRTPQERQEASRKGSQERIRRLYHFPHTEIFEGHGIRLVERVVPWWPHHKNRQRRKRPVFVRIELECVSINT